MTGADGCLENDISVSTFYNWVIRCRKMAEIIIFEQKIRKIVNIHLNQQCLAGLYELKRSLDDKI